MKVIPGAGTRTRTRSGLWPWTALLSLACMIACLVAPAGLAAQGKADAVSAATGADWKIGLSGVRNETLTTSFYEKLFNAGPVARRVEKRGVAYEYRGVPLWKIVAMIDGADSYAPYVFDEAKWKAGYTVTLVAADGYTATFSTADLAPDALILAVEENGKWGAPQTVGDSPRNLWVRDLVSIETGLAPLPAPSGSRGFSLELEINGKKASYTLDELRSSDLYMEARGSYTTSAGTRYSGLYGGVRLRGLIERYAKLSDRDSLTFTAMDGYEMTYPGSLVLDEKAGVWLLAFSLDGEELPKDPGYIRTIKVGPEDPNIDGHLSVRMVRKIVVRQKNFVDFSLSLSGKMEHTFDRVTVQSCVSCHGRTVTFERKGTSAVYSGFPAWLLLGYVDDPDHAPHRQDKSVVAYRKDLARAGYPVDFIASDGFRITLDSKELDGNDDVLVAMYKGDDSLGEDEFPLVLVWDRNAKLVPAGIKNVKMLSAVRAKF